MHAATSSLWWHQFKPATPMHVLAVAGVAVGCIWLVAVGRAARRRGPATARWVNRLLAVALLAFWVALVVYFLMPARRGWGQSLPLHICHVVALAGPVAVATRNRLARALVYFWGIGLSTQAMLTPILTVGPAHAIFWVYWLWHGSLVGAAAYDLGARRYRPTWSDWQLAVAAALVYVPVVFTVDSLLYTDYGWVGRGSSLERWTLLNLFGPWPGRVPWLLLAACGVMAVLTLSWRRNWPGQAATAPILFPVAEHVERPLRSAA